MNLVAVLHLNFLKLTITLKRKNMKFLTKLFVLAMAILVLAIGCKKENQAIMSDNEINKEFKEAPRMRLLWGYYVSVPPWHNELLFMPLGCHWPPANCLPTVVIYGDAIDGTDPQQMAIEASYENFTTAIENGNMNRFIQTTEAVTLFPDIVLFPDVISGLANSEIIMHQEVGEDGLDYYICLPDSVDYTSNWLGLEECVFVIDNQSN